ncbi:menaquinone-dependent protoporphyrinogen oxidase [Tamaricihabitans halophyticus]|uniref:Menaquinone-dependent protoporphyrinogen oxidase n=1 Tax=Tamaricihabitans halophyticus TaxID=1262583 RepID=A0A4R2Q209_9PSEU|nr:flavodoxin domain-containing protein [Tamaricihabitans halophyticus]TCP41648.1 menaquinone-dependent protoporphyrinogen oxidase [Tamaricihabitans halophyticus]
MMRVLVAYASKMGSTQEIATEIGKRLRAAELDVDVRSAGEVYGVDSYQAVVLGSALYNARWRREAVRVLKRHSKQLADRPVWLFQSGPIGPEAAGKQLDLPVNVARLANRIGAVPAVTFDGKLDPATASGLLARRLATGSRAGDFRDWERIRSWAETIATEIAGTSTEASGSVASES